MHGNNNLVTELDNIQFIRGKSPRISFRYLDHTLELNVIPFKIFKLLISRRNRVVCYEEIIYELYPEYRLDKGLIKVIQVHVSRLRKSLKEQIETTDLITTVSFYGYAIYDES